LKNEYCVIYEKEKHFQQPKCRKHFRLNFEKWGSTRTD